MAKLNAGETVSLEIDNFQLKVKIEDASKSEYISAKVEDSTSPNYPIGSIHEFDRKLFADK